MVRGGIGEVSVSFNLLGDWRPGISSALFNRLSLFEVD